MGVRGVKSKSLTLKCRFSHGFISTILFGLERSGTLKGRFPPIFAKNAWWDDELWPEKQKCSRLWGGEEGDGQAIHRTGRVYKKKHASKFPIKKSIIFLNFISFPGCFVVSFFFLIVIVSLRASYVSFQLFLFFHCFFVFPTVRFLIHGRRARIFGQIFGTRPDRGGIFGTRSDQICFLFFPFRALQNFSSPPRGPDGQDGTGRTDLILDRVQRKLRKSKTNQRKPIENLISSLFCLMCLCSPPEGLGLLDFKKSSLPPSSSVFLVSQHVKQNVLGILSKNAKMCFLSCLLVFFVFDWFSLVSWFSVEFRWKSLK